MAVSTVLLNAVEADGPGAVLDCSTGDEAIISVSGDFDAKVGFEASIDGGSTYFSYTGCLFNLVNGTKVTSVSSSCYVVFDVKPITHLRPVVSNYKRGQITAVGRVEGQV